MIMDMVAMVANLRAVIELKEIQWYLKVNILAWISMLMLFIPVWYLSLLLLLYLYATIFLMAY